MIGKTTTNKVTKSIKMKANKWRRNNNRIMVMMIRIKEVFREVLRAVFLRERKKMMRKEKGRMGTVK